MSLYLLMSHVLILFTIYQVNVTYHTTHVQTTLTQHASYVYILAVRSCIFRL